MLDYFGVYDTPTITWAGLAEEFLPAAYTGSLEALFQILPTNRPSYTALIGDALAIEWGLAGITPDNCTREQATLLDVTGWEHGPVGQWMTYRRGGRYIHLGFIPWMTADPRSNPLFADALRIDPSTRDLRRMRHLLLCGQLAAWHEATGVDWRGTPGVAGTALLRSLHDNRKRPGPLWHWVPPICPSESEISRWNAPDHSPAWAPQQVTSKPVPILLDGVRAYLAAADVAEVSRGRLDHTGARPFDPHAPGWWRISADPWRYAERMPDPLGRSENTVASVWVSTPTLRLWDQLSENPEWSTGYTILDSYTGRSSRIFRPWATVLDQTYRQAPNDQTSGACVKAAAKDVYRQTIGLMNREHGLIYRPDWHYTIIAQQRAQLLRRIWRAGIATGRWPVVILTDAVGYLDHAPATAHPEKGSPLFILGDRLGNYQKKCRTDNPPRPTRRTDRRTDAK